MSGDTRALPYRRGVGVMLANTDGDVFVGQRIDTEMPAWQMPQGGIDKGESPRDAALRELCEETGVTANLVRIEAETEGWIAYDLPADIVPRVWNGRFRGQEQKWFLARFMGRDGDIDISTDHPEFSEWRWLPPEELIASIVPFKRALYEQVLEAFLPHLRPEGGDRQAP
ncbi:RNA pyrophosphohydrolase [Roseovarius amoyensis]|uniref:RNA pyrophosphohydrolase n=1 Tax=Roseovarius amoyensis TaxID=2211448 RepID=UPI000DBE9708|nr:RNA pyrophosphohydrolase [Roseovarius amoyensis]